MNVLAVFAHPDDEVLGCGGTLAKHIEAGDYVLVSVLAQRHLEREFEMAVKTLGRSEDGRPADHWRTDLPDQAFDTIPFGQIIAKIEMFGSSFDIIYTHHPGDLNTDHALVAKAVLTAFRPKPGEKPRTILACEVLSSTEYTFPQQFSPNWYEEISYQQRIKKTEAMMCYPSELKPPRDQQGIEASLWYRGNQCGVQYAEAFQLLRRGPM